MILQMVRMGSDQYLHSTISHSLDFVDPTTLVHTQNIEDMWMVAKMKKKKRQMRQHSSSLDSHFSGIYVALSKRQSTV